MIARLFVVAVITVLASRVASGVTETFDLHLYWDSRCAECHGHSGDFAHRFLKAEDGRLVGTHHVEDMMLFLQNHGVPERHAGPIYRMLLAQAASGAQFKSRCARCHENAAELVRQSVLVRGGVPYGRASGVPISEFLISHAMLTAEEVPFWVETIARIEGEINTPY